MSRSRTFKIKTKTKTFQFQYQDVSRPRLKSRELQAGNTFTNRYNNNSVNGDVASVVGAASFCSTIDDRRRKRSIDVSANQRLSSGATQIRRSRTATDQTSARSLRLQSAAECRGCLIT